MHDIVIYLFTGESIHLLSYARGFVNEPTCVAYMAENSEKILDFIEAHNMDYDYKVIHCALTQKT